MLGDRGQPRAFRNDESLGFHTFLALSACYVATCLIGMKNLRRLRSCLDTGEAIYVLGGSLLQCIGGVMAFRITIAGDIGSGKSTIAKRLAELAGVEPLSTGGIQ